MTFRKAYLSLQSCPVRAGTDVQRGFETAHLSERRKTCPEIHLLSPLHWSVCVFVVRFIPAPSSELFSQLVGIDTGGNWGVSWILKNSCWYFTWERQDVSPGKGLWGWCGWILEFHPARGEQTTALGKQGLRTRNGLKSCEGSVCAHCRAQLCPESSDLDYFSCALMSLLVVKMVWMVLLLRAPLRACSFTVYWVEGLSSVRL